MNLVIVESPSKAKTIERFLGKGFKVESSFGHIRDLQKKGMGVEIENGFNPVYEISPKSKKTVSQLRKQIKLAKTVWLATDEDREGEAIAWHLFDELKLKQENTQRITFNEITKEAVLESIEKPRKINLDLVNAQQARRVIDRLVGFELSSVLWKKVRFGLSAGRVQSVAVRLVVEKEIEINAFKHSSQYKVFAHVKKDGEEFKLELDSTQPDEETTQNKLLSFNKEAWVVERVERKESVRKPSAPFTTSSLQQTAANTLGFSVKRTMMAAQRLYESGYITYMRTDSVSLSEKALEQIGGWIKKNHGANQWMERRYKTKSSSAQEAHEAIRPSDVNVESLQADSDQQKLYSLIWRQTIASQFANAKISRTTIKVNGGGGEPFSAQGEEVLEEGFMKITGKKIKTMLLPNLKKGDQVIHNQIYALQVFNKPPARYSEASLVKKLEELGIGRPSTYAPTISTIQDRGYVEVRDLEAQTRSVKRIELIKNSVKTTVEEERWGSEQARMEPTQTAFLVTHFLAEHTKEVVDYNFTAHLESCFDEIAQGKKVWQEMVSSFYHPFHLSVEGAQQAERPAESQARQLGEHPTNQKTISVKVGRYGPYIQVGENDESSGEKAIYASLRKGQNPDKITIEEALELLKLPRKLGTVEQALSFLSQDGTEYSIKPGSELIANEGRFGPYIQYGTKQYCSLKKEHPSALEITYKEAVEIVSSKLKQDADKHLAIYKKGAVLALKGPYGSYLKQGRKNFKIPEDKDATSLTEQEVESILNQTKKPTRRRVKKS